MATTDVFRGLAQTNLDAYGPPDAADPYVAAFPTFRTFTPAGGSARDELILLRASVATMQALRLVNTIGPGTLDFWDENNIPQIFRSVNSPGRRGGFPTFTYGRNSSGRFMNAVLLKTGFRIIVVPPTTPGFEIPTNVELMCGAAQTWAEANGHRAAFPTFTPAALPGAQPADPPGHELIVLPSTLTGVVVNSRLAAGLTLLRWTFSDLPVPLGAVYGDQPFAELDPNLIFVPVEEGLAVTENSGSPVVIFRDEDNLVQFRPDATTERTSPIDPDAAGTRRQSARDLGSLSAASAGGSTHVIWGGPSVFHGRRADTSPGGFSYLVANTPPTPPLDVGNYNRAFIAPDGMLHVLAYAQRSWGDDTSGESLLHLTFDGTTWSQRVVDGDAGGSGHVAGDCGAECGAAFEPDGTMHAFYLLRRQFGSATETFQLRHAVLTPAGWSAETLDGMGATAGSTAPPGMGPTTAHVGFSPAAAFFDGALWVAYEDRTFGNIRCARGRRTAAGVLTWEFHVVDGSAGRRRTSDDVRSVVAQVWDSTLSLVYSDFTQNVIRHAMRRAGATNWRYEVLDGQGGIDGRTVGEMIAPIAMTGTRRGDGTSSLPVFVVYCARGAGQPRFRIGTLQGQSS